jgi:hypothetical protein
MEKPSTQTPRAEELSSGNPRTPTRRGARGSRVSGPAVLAALAGVVAAGAVLSAAELVGAFFTAQATPLIALGSTFIDFTPPWLKDFAIATFGTGDKLALFIGMAVTIVLLACALGIVAYRRWALGALGVLLMGAVIVASVLTRAGAQPLDALPSVIGTAAGLMVLRVLTTLLRRTQQRPDRQPNPVLSHGPAQAQNDASPDRPATSRRAFFTAAGITAAVSAVAATGGRLLGSARSNAAQARNSLQLPAPAKAAPAVPAGVQSGTPG